MKHLILIMYYSTNLKEVEYDFFFFLLLSALQHLASKRCVSESKLQWRAFAVSWHGKIPKFSGRAIGFSLNFLFLFFQEKKKGKKKLEKVYKVVKHLLILKDYSTKLKKESMFFFFSPFCNTYFKNSSQ